MQAVSDPQSLQHGSLCRRVSGQIAGCCYHDQAFLLCFSPFAVLANGGLEHLKTVKLGILSDQGLGQSAKQVSRLAAVGEVSIDETAGFVHLLLAVQEIEVFGQQLGYSFSAEKQPVFLLRMGTASFLGCWPPWGSCALRQIARKELP